MALIDEVQARYSMERLLELTNPDARTATTVNTTRLAYAVADAEAEFASTVGTAFDSSDAQHVALGCQGVLVYLMQYQGLVGDEYGKLRTDWKDQLQRLRKTSGANAWAAPQTTSNLNPTREDADQTPPFDPDNLADWMPTPLERS